MKKFLILLSCLVLLAGCGKTNINSQEVTDNIADTNIYVENTSFLKLNDTYQTFEVLGIDDDYVYFSAPIDENDDEQFQVIRRKYKDFDKEEKLPISYSRYSCIDFYTADDMCYFLLGELVDEKLVYHVVVYEVNGEINQDIAIDNLSEGKPERLVSIGNGTLGIRANDILYILDADKVSQKISCPENSTSMICYDGNIYFLTPTKVLSYSLTEKTIKEELEIQGRNIVPDKIISFGRRDDRYIFLSYTSDQMDVKVTSISNGLDGERDLLVCDNDGRQIIYLYDATGELANYITSPVDSFNEHNANYQIVMRNYELSMDENDVYSTAKVIAAGEYPDIILSPYTSQVDIFLKNGWLEDLTPYIEKSTEYSMEDFSPVILSAYTKEGKLFALPDSIYFEALYGPTETLGEGNWNLEEFLVWLQEHPQAGGMVMTRRQIFDACSDCLLKKYIQGNEAHFDEVSFCNFLARFRALQRKDSYSQKEAMEMYENAMERVSTLIYSPSSIAGLEIDTGIDLTVKGFPSNDEIPGVYITSPAASIVSSSRVKEGAYEFLEYYMGYAPSILLGDLKKPNSVRFFTINSYWEIGIDALLEIEYEEDKTISSEQIAKMESIMQYAKLKDYSNNTLKEIIWEELLEYLDSDKDEESSSRAIQNRVQLYLDEKQ